MTHTTTQSSPAADSAAPAPSSVARMRSILSHISTDRLASSSQTDADAALSVSWAAKGTAAPLDPATRWNGWGYVDTKLFINDRRVIELSGERYGEVFASAKDRTLPELLPWAVKVIGIDPDKTSPATNIDVNQLRVIGAPVEENPELQQRLIAFLDTLRQRDANDIGAPMRTSTTLEERVRHGHGQTCEEIYRLRHLNEIERIPDAVVWPQSHVQVEQLVREAVAQSEYICLIPHGGGTNVSNALDCNPNERRAIVSVDLRDMRAILHVDKENMLVRVEAGITGLDLHERLRHKGLTLGHEPDSWEFSTLGGWVATRASGMKKNVYGNIEDLVVNVKTVTAQGTMQRSANVPRVSMGPDTTQLLLGSEGILGIFTEVTLRVRAFPKVQLYDSLVFPNFEHGIAAMHDVLCEKTVPASIRLLDNAQFQLGQALKTSSGSGHNFTNGVLEFAKKTYVTKIRGFEVSQMCAATVLMEGTQEEVDRQQAAIHAIAKRHAGLVGGAESGKRGYFFTYIIAYLRDFALDYYFMSESFETAIPWSNVQQLCTDIKLAINTTAVQRKVTIPPLIACRVTQLYETGVCVYVYYGLYYYGVKDALSLFKQIEHAAIGAIVANGGSLSHHHGIGKHRRPFLPSAISQPGIAAIQGIKTALDPTNVFAAGNILEPPASPPESSVAPSQDL
ncbi:Alkyldihydroxyacetonephosphate synthase, peroxisomal, partial [Globisporangium splendens]